MSTKHTPGPWEYDCGIIPPDGPGRYSDIYVDGGDKVIASVNEFFITSRQEGEANAHLIAASPEMLQALQISQTLLKKVSPHKGQEDLLIAAIEMNDAVISKALGKTA